MYYFDSELNFDKGYINQAIKEYIDQYGYIPTPADFLVQISKKYLEATRSHNKSMWSILESLEKYKDKDSIKIDELMDIVYAAWPEMDRRKVCPHLEELHNIANELHELLK